MGFLANSIRVATGAAVCAAACTVALAGCTTGAAERTVVVSDKDAAPTITVTAESEVSVVPDKAEVGIAVTTQATSAEETQRKNTELMNAVIDALKGLGIDEKSIQTTDTYLNPRYDYSVVEPYATIAPAEPAADGQNAASGLAAADDEETEAAAPATTGSASTASEPVTDIAPAAASDGTNIVGYEMTTRLAVRDLNIDQVGEALSTCVAAGANNTDGIRYYSSEYDAKYAEALAAAVDAARAKADVLAKAGGVSLGNVYSMVEGYQNTAYRYDTGATMEAMASDAAMKVMPGEVDVTASVTVSYEVG